MRAALYDRTHEPGAADVGGFSPGRRGKATPPPGSLLTNQIEQPDPMVAAGQTVPGTGAQPIDPNTMLMLRVLDGLGKLAEPMAAIAKQPGGKGPYVFATVMSVVCSLVFSMATIWVHDQTSTGRIGNRLDDHDDAIAAASEAVNEQGADIKALVEVVGGLIDEGESDMDWMEEALAAGFAGRPIPKRSTAGRNRLRRMVPSP